MKKNIKVLVISLVLLIGLLSILVINKGIDLDKNKGKIKVTKVDVETKGSKTEKIEVPKKENPEEKEIKEIETISSFKTLKYKIKYKLESVENIKRDAIITVKISDEDTKYVILKKVEEKDITSTIKENGKQLEIEIKNVETNKEQEIEIEVEITNAPDGYKFSPVVEVREKTSEKLNKEVKVEEVEVRTTSIEGSVRNKETKESAKNVEVKICKINGEICEEEKSTYTDENGKYVLSELEEGTYKISTEEGYEVENAIIDVEKGKNVVNVIIDQKEKFSASIKKYLETIKVGEKEYKIERSQKVVLPIKGNTKEYVKATYVFEIENVSKVSGYISTIKESLPKGFKISKEYEENKNWKEKEGSYYNTSLANEKLGAGEIKEVRIQVESEGKVDAKEYVNNVEMRGESYHKVKYVVDGKVVREIEVADTDKIDNYEYEEEGKEFEGWYLDSEYTKEYDFNKIVEKDIILYGKLSGETVREYTVTYIINDEVYEQKVVQEGERAEEIEAPEEEGYDFEYWRKEGETGRYRFNEEIRENIILYGEYKKKKYTVTYYIKEEGEEYRKLNEIEIEHGEKTERPEMADQEKFTFENWYKEEGLENAYDFDTEIKKDTNIYGIYRVKRYTIRFYEKNEIDEDYLIRKYENYPANEIIEYPEAPEKEGYTFTNKWNKVGTSEEYHFVGMMATEDVDLYAEYSKNKYNLKVKTKYDEEGIEKTNEEDYELEYEEEKIINDPETREMYNFTGWKIEKTNPEGTGNKGTYNENTKIYKMRNADTTMEALYEEKKYTIEYYEEDNTLINKEENVRATEIITIPEIEEKTHYHFVEWTYNGNRIELEGKTAYQIFKENNVEGTTIRVKVKREGNKYQVRYVDYNDSLLEEEEVEYPNRVQKKEVAENKAREENHYVGHTYSHFNIGNERVTDYSERLIEKCENETNCVLTLKAEYTTNILGVVFYDETKTTSVEVEYGSKIDETKIPEEEGKEGYTFSGWYEKENGEYKTNPFDMNTTIEETKYVYAKYTPVTYTIHYNKNAEEAEGNYTDQEFTIESEGTIRTSGYGRVGYEYEGWSIEANGEIYTKTSLREIARELIEENQTEKTLYAKWTPISYTVRYNANGGNGEMADQTFTYDESKNLRKNTYTKEGYSFDGWTYNSQNYADEEEVRNLTTEKNGIVILIAKWKKKTYTLTINANGGTFEGETTREIEYQGQSEVNKPTKRGYTFKEWKIEKTNEEGEGTKGHFIDETTYEMLSADTTITAIYEEKKYSVRYEANGGSGEMTPTEFGYEVETTEEIKENGFSKEGYKFAYWTTESGEKYETTKLKEIAEELEDEGETERVIYAKWTPINYRIKFVAPDGYSGEVTSYYEEMTYDETKALLANRYEKEYYEFKYWQGPNGTYSNEEEVRNLTSEENGVVELKAIMARNAYVVKYMKDLTTEYRTVIVSKGNKAENIEGPEKIGYTFDYWSEEIGEEEYDFNEVLERDIVLYANYEINEYKVRFLVPGEYGVYKNLKRLEKSIAYQEKVARPSEEEEEEIEYYRFVGWYESDKTTEFDFENRVIEEDTDIYGLYEKITYDVRFYEEDKETLVSDQSGIEADQTIQIPEAPTKRGYTFNEWKDKRTNTAYEFPSDMKPVEDVDLYASYTINKYNLKVKTKYDEVGVEKTREDTYELEYEEGKLVNDPEAREMYNFTGWRIEKTNTSGAGEKGTYNAETKVYKMKDADTTMEALYELKDYTIEFYEKDRITKINNKEEYEANEVVEEPEAQIDEHYHFSKWEDAEGNEINVTGKTAYQVFKNNNKEEDEVLKLYAVEEGNRYEVRYVDYDNSAIKDNENEEIKETVIYPNEITRQVEAATKGQEKNANRGYIFSYWEVNGKNLGEIADKKDLIEECETEENCVVILKAKYNETEVGIVFHDEGNTNGSTTYTGTYNEAIPANAIPEKAGKLGYRTNEKWYTEENGEEEYDLSTPLTSIVDVYAKYTPKTYTIHYNKNAEEASGDYTDQEFTIESDGSVRTTGYAREGYEYAGWSIEANGEAYTKTRLNEIAEELATANEEEKTLYAKWTPISYTVVFDGNGNTGGETANQTFTYDESKNLRKNGYTKKGNRFKGWATEANGEKVYTDEESVRNLTSIKNGIVRLYAVWEEIDYTLTIETIGGSISIDSSQTLKYNETKNIPNPTKEGYTFDHWEIRKTTNEEVGEDKEEAEVGEIENKVFTMKNADTTISAVYRAKSYKVTYRAKGIETTYEDIFAYDVEEGTIRNPEIFEVTGYRSIGWGLEEDSTEVTYTGNTSKKSIAEALESEGKEEIDLYLVKEPISYTVRYNANGGTGEMLDQDFKYDEAQNLRKNEYTKEGYSFDGWTYNSQNFADEEEVINLTSEDNQIVTLTAKWTINKYTVTFYNLNENDEKVLYQTINDVDHGSTVSKPSSNPTRITKKFKYWKINNHDDNEEYIFSTPVTSNLVLVSVYEDIEAPTITANPDDRWTNGAVTVTLSNNSGLAMKYKTIVGETSTNYTEYENLLTITEQGTKVRGKSYIEETGEESAESEKQINNIDKELPTIGTETMTSSLHSVKLEVPITDNLSGIDTAKIQINLNNGSEDETKCNISTTKTIETKEIDGIVISELLTGPHNYTYECIVDGLEEVSIYNAKIIAKDIAGNETEKSITIQTIEMAEVARIISYDGTDVEDRPEYDPEALYPYRYESLAAALEDCNNISTTTPKTCTIQMTDNTSEGNNTVTINQDIILDLNGKTVSGTESTTITNNGRLRVIDTGETAGKIENNYIETTQEGEDTIITPLGTAINNTGYLIIGINEAPSDDEMGTVIDATKPLIEGNKIGINTILNPESGEGLAFYDGTIKGGTSSITGTVTTTPYLYNVTTAGTSPVVSNLVIQAEAVARVKRTRVYYTQLDAATSNTYSGTYQEEAVGPETDLTNLVEPSPNALYSFEPSEETEITLKDLSGNGHDGKVYGATLTEDNGLYFDGKDDFVDAGVIGLQNNHSVTYDFTIKYSDSQKSSTLMGVRNDKYGAIVGIDTYSIDKINQYSYGNFARDSYYPTYALTSNQKITNDVTHRITAVFDYENTKMKLYIDGQLDSEKNYLSITNISSSNFIIGCLNRIKSFYKGNIYEVKVYNKALNESEITNANTTDELILYYDLSKENSKEIQTKNILKNTSINIYNSQAMSYVKIDLTNEDKNQMLVVNASLDEFSGAIYGYAVVHEEDENYTEKTVPTYNSTTGRFIYLDSTIQPKDYSTILEKGKVYYLYFGLYNDTNTNIYNIFKINSIKLYSYNLQSDLLTNGSNNYYFIKEVNYLKNNNQNIHSSVANSYMMIDTTGYTENKTLTVNAEISSEGCDKGYATLTESITIPSYDNTTGRFIYISGTVNAADYTTTLEPNKIYYLHFGYRKDGSGSGGTDTFKINQIKIGDEELIDKTLTLDSLTYEETVPVLNETADTVEMLKNITLNNSLVINDNKDMIIDLRGYTLDSSTSDYLVKNTGSLKITDSKYNEELEEHQNTYEELTARYQAEYEEELEEFNNTVDNLNQNYKTDYITEVENQILNNSQNYNYYSTDDYVQDGLILHLDGKNHEESTTTWNDLSGNNNDFTINNGTWVNNIGLNFNGNSNSYAIKSNGITSETLSAETVEVLFSLVNTNNSVIYAGSNKEKISIGIWGNKLSVNTRHMNYGYFELPSNIADGEKHKITVTYSDSIYKVYFDNSEVSYISASDGWGYDSNTYLGGISSYYSKSTIYSVKTYNRVLTAEEIEQNYLIDEVRYNYPTSNTSNGTISSTSESNNTYKMFDGEKTTIFTTNNQEEVITWEKLTENTIKSFKIYGTSDTTKYPSSVKFEGSKDGENYETIIEEQELEAKGQDEYNEISIPINNIDSYKYYKWTFKNTNGIEISEIELEEYNVSRTIYNPNDTTFRIEAENTNYSEGAIASNTSYSNGKVLQNPAFIEFEYNIIDDFDTKTYLNIYGQYLTVGFKLLFNNTIINFDNVTTDSYTKLNIELSNLQKGTNIIRIERSSSSLPWFDYFEILRDSNPVLQVAELEQTELTGNLASTSGNVIYNEDGAYLEIDDAIINCNKSGTNQDYSVAIKNYGTIKLNKDAIINVNSSTFAIGIDNMITGKILSDYVTIKTNINNAYILAIRNYSQKQDKLEKINFNLITSTIGIENYSSKDLLLDKLTFIGNGTGIRCNSSNSLNINNNNFNGNIYININNSDITNKIEISSSNIEVSNMLFKLNSKSDLLINNGTYKLTSYENNIINEGNILIKNGIFDSKHNIISGSRKIIIENGTFNIRDYCIYNSSNININNGLFNCGTFIGFPHNITNLMGGTVNTSTGINYPSDYINMGNDFTLTASSYIFNLNGGDNNSVITIGGNAKISGSDLYRSSSTTEKKGSLLVKDNAEINLTGALFSDSYAYNKENFIITMGEKDGTVSTTKPKISTTTSLIDNLNGNFYKVNYYDGVLIGQKDNVVKGLINDSEPDYDLNIESESETLDKVTLGTTSDLAQIEGGGTYPTIQAAIDNLPENTLKKIIVLKDLKTLATNTLPINKKTNIDLNGHIIETYSAKPLFVSNGELELSDNTASKSGNVVTLGTGQITSRGSKVIENNNKLDVGVKVNATKNIVTLLDNKAGKTTINEFGYLSANNNNNTIINNDSSESVIIEGTLDSSSTISGYTGTTIINNNAGKIILNETGKITSTATAGGTSTGIKLNAGEFEINKGTIDLNLAGAGSNQGRSIYAIDMYENTKLTINGGSVKSVYKSYQSPNDLIRNAGGEVTINYGDLVGNIDNTSGTIDIKQAENKTTKLTINNLSNAGALNIYDGIFTGNGGTMITNSGTANIYAGKYVYTGSGITNSGTLTLGRPINDILDGEENVIVEGDGDVSKTIPLIAATSNGVTNNGTFNWYDGVIYGTTAIVNSISAQEQGYDVILKNNEQLTLTENTDGINHSFTYTEEKYLDQLPLFEIKDDNGDVTANQCGDTEYKACVDLKTALEKVNDGYTLEVLRDATITSSAEPAVNTKNVTIDLKGYNIIAGNNPYINNTGTLQIIDSGRIENETTIKGKIQTTATTLITNTGTLTIDADLSKITSDGILIENSGTGSLTLTQDGKLSCNKKNCTVINNTSNNNNAVTINGHIILSNNNSSTDYQFAIKSSDGKLIINSTANINMTASYGKLTALKILGGTVEINEVEEIKVSTSTPKVIDVEGNPTIIINGGTFTSIDSDNSSDNGSLIYTPTDSSPTITINYGTLTGYIDHKSTAGIININQTTEKITSIINNKRGNMENYGTINMTSGSITTYDGIVNYGTFNMTGGLITFTNTSFFNYNIVNIYAGTIIFTNNTSLSNSGTLQLGKKRTPANPVTGELYDSTMTLDTPIIRTISSSSEAIINKGTFKWYDGKIQTKEKFVTGVINEIEDNHQIIEGTEEIESETYKVRYLAKTEIAKIYDEHGVEKANACSNNVCYSLQDAIDNAQNNETIKVVRNVTYTNNDSTLEVPSGKNITIDINGYKIIGSNNTLINNNGTLNLIDTSTEIINVTGNNDSKSGSGEITGYAETLIENNGTLIIDGIKIQESLGINIYLIYNKATLIIQKGYFYSYYSGYRGNSIAIRSKPTIITSSESITINGGYFKSDRSYYGYSPSINVSEGEKVLVNGGYVDYIGSHTIWVEDRYENYDLTVTGGTINSIDQYGTCSISGGTISYINLKNSSTINGDTTITGGTFNSISSESNRRVIVNPTNDADVTINGLDSHGTTIINKGTFSSIASRGDVTINGGIFNEPYLSIVSSSTLTINGGTFNEKTGDNVISNQGTTTINNVSLSATGKTITNSGTLNVNSGTTITSTNGTAIENTGTVTLGEGLIAPDPYNPLITVQGTTYGINTTGNGVTNFNDGKVIGATNQSLVGRIVEYPGYTTKKEADTNNSSLDVATLKLIGVSERKVNMNGTNFIDLQAAINSAVSGQQNNLLLYETIDLTSNITIPDNTTIIVDLNGCSFNKGDYHFVGGTNSVFQTTDNVNLLGTVRGLLGNETIRKNIVVFNDDNGKSLNSGEVYTLKLKVESGYEEIDVKENVEQIGRYEIATKKSDDKIRTINGNVYISNISEGEYVLEGNKGTKATFVVHADGTLSGNIRNTYINSNTVLNTTLATSSANLIVGIQTGRKLIRYSLIIMAIGSIISLLFIVKKKTKINS